MAGERGTTMKKLISFKKLKSICVFEDAAIYTSPTEDGRGSLYSASTCTHKDGGDKLCCSKNCPIWRKLK
jgi:hypothetical protein